MAGMVVGYWDGKAKRTDVLPMHPQIAEELQHRRDEVMATPQVRIFPQTVSDLTRQKDFLRAGIAREEVVTGDDGQPVMIGKGKWRRPKTRIVTKDAEGRVVDLHAMRTTLGTKLARQGVKPQVAREIMRHSDYKMTLKHYTVLGLSDTTGAINELPNIGRTEPVKVTGTLSASADPQQIHQQIHQQSVHGTVRNGASQYETDKLGVPQDRTSDDTVNTASCETKRNDATICDHDAGVTKTAERQMPTGLAGGKIGKDQHQEGPPREVSFRVGAAHTRSLLLAEFRRDPERQMPGRKPPHPIGDGSAVEVGGDFICEEDVRAGQPSSFSNDNRGQSNQDTSCPRRSMKRSCFSVHP